MPVVPDPGIVPAVRYTLTYLRASWQRRSAVKVLQDQIREDTTALDSLLGSLGQEVRARGVDSRALSGENEAIDQAEKRRGRAERECAELTNRQAEENARFGEIEGERVAKLDEAESRLKEGEDEVEKLEAERRGAREKLKEVVRRQKGYLKIAEDREAEASKLEMGDARSEMRRAAEDLRTDAANLDPERQEIESHIAELERPIAEGQAENEGHSSAVEQARRSLNDAREGHRHRLAEIEAEQGRKSRELAQAEAEIQRRLVTLGTLVNLHRVDQPEFSDLYREIDAHRGAIGARSNQIDRLNAEREAYDKGALIRGGVALAGALVILISIIAIVLAVF